MKVEINESELPITFFRLEQIEEWTEKLVKGKGRYTEEDFKNLKEDILKNGLKEPLIVKRQGDRYIGINGGHRYLVLKELGYKVVPCKVK